MCIEELACHSSQRFYMFRAIDQIGKGIKGDGNLSRSEKGIIDMQRGETRRDPVDLNWRYRYEFIICES